MDENTLKTTASEILYNEDKLEVCHTIMDISDSDLLHIIATNYNWDNGFEIPNSIVENKYCALSTALLIFFYAEGEQLLEMPMLFDNSKVDERGLFISKLKKMILENKFQKRGIEYIPPFSKVQIFKMKKLDNISNVFFEVIEGKKNDIKL